MKKVFSAVIPICLSANTVKTAREHNGAIVMEISLRKDAQAEFETVSFIDRRPQTMMSFKAGGLTISEVSLPAKMEILESPSGRIEVIADKLTDKDEVISTLLFKEYTDTDRATMLCLPDHAWRYPESQIKRLPALGIQAS